MMKSVFKGLASQADSLSLRLSSPLILQAKIYDLCDTALSYPLLESFL